MTCNCENSHCQLHPVGECKGTAYVKAEWIGAVCLDCAVADEDFLIPLSEFEGSYSLTDELWAEVEAFLKAKREETRMFVTAYEVTRHYGGPEEGGWWYNWFEPIQTVPVAKEDAETMVSVLKERYEDRVEGNIYSVLGGTAVDVIIEDEPATHATTERPRYE